MKGEEMEQEAGNHVILKPLEDARHSDISCLCKDVSLMIAGIEMYKNYAYPSARCQVEYTSESV